MEIYGKCQKLEEGDMPSLFKGVPMLKGGLKLLKILTEEENPPRRKIG